MTVVHLETVFVGTALLSSGIGAVTDTKTRRLPNWLTLPSLLIGLLLHFVLGGWYQSASWHWTAAWRSLGSAALATLIAGGIFLIFHMAGGMGAGDVKMMAAVGALAGLSHIAEILVATGLVGGIFAIVLAIAKGRLKTTLSNIGVLMVHHGTAGLQPHSNLNVTNTETLRLPYGIAIAAGTALAFCNVLLVR